MTAHSELFIPSGDAPTMVLQSDRDRYAALLDAAKLYGDSDTGDVLWALAAIERRQLYPVGGEAFCNALEGALEEFAAAVDQLEKSTGKDLSTYWEQSR
jgi:hypothetical protein